MTIPIPTVPEEHRLRRRNRRPAPWCRVRPVRAVKAEQAVEHHADLRMTRETRIARRMMGREESSSSTIARKRVGSKWMGARRRYGLEKRIVRGMVRPVRTWKVSGNVRRSRKTCPEGSIRGSCIAKTPAAAMERVLAIRFLN